MIGAAAACLAAAAAVAATAAVDGGGQGAPQQDDSPLLPEAHAHSVNRLAVTAYAVGPRQVNVIFNPALPNVDNLLGIPSMSDHRARTQTGYSVGSGGTTHTITLSGPDMQTDATGSLLVSAGDVHFGRPGLHVHRISPSLAIPVHDRQAPRIDTSVTPTLNMSAGTFTFRATEPLAVGPGGAAPRTSGWRASGRSRPMRRCPSAEPTSR